jgi:hypothetical protein
VASFWFCFVLKDGLELNHNAMDLIAKFRLHVGSSLGGESSIGSQDHFKPKRIPSLHEDALNKAKQQGPQRSECPSS